MLCLPKSVYSRFSFSYSLSLSVEPYNRQSMARYLKPTATPGAELSRTKRKLDLEAEITQQRVQSFEMLEPMLALRAKWIEAYAKLPVHLRDMSPAERRKHVCSESCITVGEYPVFACVVSAFVHTCSEECTTRIETPTNEVCIFSGRTFPLEFKESVSHNIGQCNDRFKAAYDNRRTTDVLSGEQRISSMLLRESALKDQEESIDARLRAEAHEMGQYMLFSKTRHEVDKRKFNPIKDRLCHDILRYMTQCLQIDAPIDGLEIHRMLTQTRSHLHSLNLLPPVNWSDADSAVVLSKIADKSVELWKLFVSKARNRVVEEKYRFAAHCQVVMYALARGIPGTLASVTGLSQLMPGEDDIAAFGYAPNLFSRANRLFNALLIECSPQTQSAYNRIAQQSVSVVKQTRDDIKRRKLIHS